MSEADDTELFKRLWYANRDGLIEIGVDLRHHNKPGAPAFSAKDAMLPYVATVCCTATAWMLGGWVWGLAILGSGVIFSLTTLNLWILHRLRQRSLEIALAGLDGWEQLWDFGGVSLRRSGEADEVDAEKVDWRLFAITLPPSANYE